MDPDGSTAGALFLHLDDRDVQLIHRCRIGILAYVRSNPMYLIPNPIRRRASPALRERFLNALDQRDQLSLRATVRDLLGCVNILPAATCILLGLARGSTYGEAAQMITSSLSVRPEAA
jgi:hypothetical protein